MARKTAEEQAAERKEQRAKHIAAAESKVKKAKAKAKEDKLGRDLQTIQSRRPPDDPKKAEQRSENIARLQRAFNGAVDARAKAQMALGKLQAGR